MLKPCLWLGMINYRKNTMKFGAIFKEIWRGKLDSDPVFGDKYLKTKIKSYNKKITINLKNVANNSTEPPKEEVKCVYLSAAVIDTVFKSIKNYY